MASLAVKTQNNSVIAAERSATLLQEYGRNLPLVVSTLASHHSVIQKWDPKHGYSDRRNGYFYTAVPKLAGWRYVGKYVDYGARFVLKIW